MSDALRPIAMALLAIVLGCSAAPGPERAPYFPLGEGRWTYGLRTPEGEGRLVVVARGAVTLPRGGVTAFLVEETMDASLGFGGTAPVAYVIEDDFVARLEGVGYDEGGELRVLGQDHPTRILPLDPRPGMGWSQETRPLGAGGDVPGPPLLWQVEVRALASLEVPAGAFDDVVEIATVLRDAGGVRRMEYRDVYARGVGLVSSVARESAGGNLALEKTLLRYEPGPTGSAAGRSTSRP